MAERLRNTPGGKDNNFVKHAAVLDPPGYEWPGLTMERRKATSSRADSPQTDPVSPHCLAS